MTTHSEKQIPEKNGTETTDEPSVISDFIHVAGFVLAVSYPILAISTGFRGVFQLFFKEGVTNYLGPSLSTVAAICYLVATIGFAVRQKWAWWLSVSFLGIETLLTLIVGTMPLTMAVRRAAGLTAALPRSQARRAAQWKLLTPRQSMPTLLQGTSFRP